jgi:hypothetical protein
MDSERSEIPTGGDGDTNSSTFESQLSSLTEQITTTGSPSAISDGEHGDGGPASKRMRKGDGGDSLREDEEGEEREKGEVGQSGDEGGSSSDEKRSDEDMVEGYGSGEGDDNEDSNGNKSGGKQVDKEDVLDEVIALSMAHLHKVEGKLQEKFRENRRKVEYQDGFLVGGLIFTGWMPSFEKIADAIRSIGISDKDLSPIGNTSTLKLLVEIRVKTQDRVEAIGSTIRRHAQRLADHLKRSFKWRDLRWVDHWTVVLKGIPVNWGEGEIKNVLFYEGRFPHRNLAAIGRPATDLQGIVGGNTLLLRYSTIPIALLGLHLADPSRLRVTVSKRKTLSWAFGSHPWGYDDSHPCDYCMTTHPDRLECPLEEVVRKDSWNAVTATLEMENMVLEGDKTAVAGIRYTVEKDYNMDIEHVPVRRPTFFSATPASASPASGMTSSATSSSSSPSTPLPTPPPSPADPLTAQGNPAPGTQSVPPNPTSTQQPKAPRKGAWNFPHPTDGGRGRGTWRGGRGK